jgi:hypothetical protein
VADFWFFNHNSEAMDATKSIQNYINKMVTSVPGLKIMLLDSDTVSTIAL